MNIFVNGEAKTTNAKTLSEVLLQLGFEGAVIATAVNETFVPEGERSNFTLEENIRVEIIAPMQGG